MLTMKRESPVNSLKPHKPMQEWMGNNRLLLNSILIVCQKKEKKKDVKHTDDSVAGGVCVVTQPLHNWHVQLVLNWSHGVLIHMSQFSLTPFLCTFSAPASTDSAPGPNHYSMDRRHLPASALWKVRLFRAEGVLESIEIITFDLSSRPTRGAPWAWADSVYGIKRSDFGCGRIARSVGGSPDAAATVTAII